MFRVKNIIRTFTKGVAVKSLLAPFALITVLMMRFFAPLIQFRVVQVYKHRIGHFALETELVALNSKYNLQKDKKSFTIYYFPDSPPANKQLDIMFRRKLYCVSGSWGWLINEMSKLFKNMNISSQRTLVDYHGLLIERPQILDFTTEELTHPDIKRLNLELSTKFVCLHVRDSVYASIFFKNPRHQLSRNCDVKTFVQACEVLANMGYTVFRTGVIVEEKLISDNQKVVDYATNGMRTDFLDIHIAQAASFVISTSSGWDNIATIFRRPILKVNLLPVITYENLSLRCVIAPKILRDMASKKPLTLNQIINRGVAKNYETDEYADAGVEIRDLSSQELVEAVTEMAQRVEGTFVETPEQKEMQAKLKHILSTHPKLQPTPNYYPIRAEFASCFLSRYPNFLD